MELTTLFVSAQGTQQPGALIRVHPGLCANSVCECFWASNAVTTSGDISIHSNFWRFVFFCVDAEVSMYEAGND